MQEVPPEGSDHTRSTWEGSADYGKQEWYYIANGDEEKAKAIDMLIDVQKQLLDVFAISNVSVRFPRDRHALFMHEILYNWATQKTLQQELI